MDVSVIIPIYNVEEYLKPCLTSVKNAYGTLETEVILVDDASTDDSGRIALDFAEKNRSFRYFKTAHKGVSAARNFGVEKASGRFLMFVDSDDVLVGNIIEKMYRQALRTKSDMAVCEVGRLKGSKVEASPLHLRAFHGIDRSLISIAEYPQLVYDATVWNKIIRRDFYLAGHLEFPEGYSYEDMPVMTHLHCLSQRTLFLHETGYLWRIRDKKNKDSVTQRLTDLQLLRDKVEMIRLLLERVQECGNEAIFRMALFKMMEIDFSGIIKELCKEDDETFASGTAMIAQLYTEHSNPDVIERLPLTYRQIYEDIVHGDLDHLRRVQNHKSNNYSKASVSDDGNVLLPNDIYTIPERSFRHDLALTPPELAITDAEIGEDEIIFRGYLYRKKISVRTICDQQVRFALLNENSSALLNLESFQFEIPGKTAPIVSPDDCRTYIYDYSGSGVGFRLKFRDLVEKDFTGEHYFFAYYCDRMEEGNRITRGVRERVSGLLAGKNFFWEGFRISFSTDIRTTLCMHVKDTKTTEKISVIVPVSNGERALKRCLDSLGGQTYENIEVLLLNHGSTDRSLKICREYAAKDDRFKVSDLSCGNTADVLNAGLDMYSGEYLMFVDTDDLPDERYLERMHEALKNSGCGIATCMTAHSDDPGIRSYTCREKKAPRIIPMEQYDYTKKWSHRVINGALFRSEIIGDSRLDAADPAGAETRLIAGLLRRGDQVVHLDEKLYLNSGSVDMSPEAEAGRCSEEAGIWELISQVFRDGPELPRETAEQNAFSQTVKALKMIELNDIRDDDLKRDLIGRIRGKESVIQKAGWDDKKIRRMTWLVRHPEMYLRLYRMKHRRDAKPSA